MAIFFMFFLYLCMIKWSNIKTKDGYNLKFPKFKNKAISFDEHSQILSFQENGKELGYDMLIKTKDRIRCKDMETDINSRKRGIGGLFHAITVMMMKENKAKCIYLESLPQAIKFHFNKGFRTNNTTTYGAKPCLESIINSNTPFSDLKSKARGLLYNLDLNDNSTIPEINRLYDEYIKRIIKNRISINDAKFPPTLEMSLSSKQASKNAQLYNDILVKFGIDYTI